MHQDEEPMGPRVVIGVSPAWQVLGVIGLLASLILLLITVGLGAAYLLERERAKRAWNGPMNTVNFPPAAPAAGGGAAWDMAEPDEPPNAPYPLVADLRPAEVPPVPGEEKTEKPAATVRDRFLKLGELAWTATDDSGVQHVTVSPDGQHLAYLVGTQLFVGSFNGPPNAVGGGAGMGALPGGPGVGAAAPGGVMGGPGFDQSMQVTDRPVWSADSKYVYFAEMEGALLRYDPLTAGLENLGMNGDCPIPVNDTSLVFRRWRPVPKADLQTGEPRPEATEIVLANWRTREVRVLIADAGSWEPLSLSPDGKQLVLAANTGKDRFGLPIHQMYIRDMADKAKTRPTRPFSAPARQVLGVGWSRDGKALLYAQSPEAPPSDRWASPAAGFWTDMELYHQELKSDRATRLSRGGALAGLASSTGDDLFVLVWQSNQGRWSQTLRRVPLQDLLGFAARDPEKPLRDAQTWDRLFDSVLDEVCITGDVRGTDLTPDVRARMADAFAQMFRVYFETSPPSDIAGWDQVMHGMTQLTLPDQDRAALVLGVALGEHLHRKHGAVWRLSAGPLMPVAAAFEAPGQETPFGLEVNPFSAARRRYALRGISSGGYGTLYWFREALVRADGRPLILANDPAEARRALDSLTDPDLARAAGLFAKKEPAAAEKLALAMLEKKQHERNHVLTLHVAKLLYDHQRFEAMRRLLDAGDATPPDARHHNLLGLAVLEADPVGAVAHFRNALRCDLHHGPAYFNMAMAFEKAKDPNSAMLCLRRYLKLQPYAADAADARQRLAALQVPEGEGGAGGVGGAPGVPGPPPQ